MNKNVICLGASGSSKTIIDILMNVNWSHKDDGFYNSLPVLNGGSYTIYPNSKGQYVQETTTYLFDEKTGAITANDVTSIILDVDANQLDALVVNMDQYLMNIAKENVTKKTLWNQKNSK